MVYLSDIHVTKIKQLDLLISLWISNERFLEGINLMLTTPYVDAHPWEYSAVFFMGDKFKCIV